MIKDFNKIVNKLLKKGGNVVFKKDLFDLIDPENKSEYKNQLDKCIYRLKAGGYIISIKAGVYIIPDSSDKDINNVDLVEKYYLKLLKKYVSKEVGSEYYISGTKSLQLHLKDMSIPQKIYVTNRNVNKKILLGGYEIIFKTLTGSSQGKKINLYRKFSTYRKDISIENLNFKVSCLELSLLESALVGDIYEGLDTGLLVRAIKKYSQVFDVEIFKEVGKYKYNMSFNRLKEISKTINKNLYLEFLDIIKKNGGCFVGEGLRGL